MDSKFKKKMMEVLIHHKQALQEEIKEEKKILEREIEQHGYSRVAEETEIIIGKRLPDDIKFIDESITILEKSMGE